MFRCGNCGTGFNATVASVSETCPRCKASGVVSPLALEEQEADANPQADAAPQPAA
ncbi:MAG: hypothetical protein U0R71_08365 [Solirubrobacterales bacterium]